MSDLTAGDREARDYDPAANNYDLAKDPRCLWGWGDYGFGYACFRTLGHEGLCWDCGEEPGPDDPPSATSQRPADWDEKGRAEANA